jgi:transcriptional regulator with XRE-family HTH domain
MKKNDISLRIKQLRTEKKLSQEAFGDLLGVSKAAISQLEVGTTALSMDLLYKIVKQFGITYDYLIDGIDHLNSNTKQSIAISDLNNKNFKDKGQVTGSGKGSGKEYKQPENAGFNISNEPQPSYGNAGKKEEGLKELSSALKAYMEANNALMAYISTLEAKLGNYEGNNNTS